jgi:hypothetical protein
MSMLHMRCAACGAINRIPEDRDLRRAEVRQVPHQGRPERAPGGRRRRRAAAADRVVAGAGAGRLLGAVVRAVSAAGAARRRRWRSKHRGRLIVVKINTEEHQGFARALGIQSIPTLCVYKDGVMVRRQLGAVMGRELENVVEPFLLP